MRLSWDAQRRSIWEDSIQLVVNDEKEAVCVQRLEGGSLLWKEWKVKRS